MITVKVFFTKDLTRIEKLQSYPEKSDCISRLILTNLLSSLMRYSIVYYSQELQDEIMNLPVTLQARFIGLTDRMMEHGPNLGLPHTNSFGGGLFELRLKGAEGIARVFFCLIVKQQIVMLHSFIKKTQKTPDKELKLAKQRMKEFKK